MQPYSLILNCSYLFSNYYSRVEWLLCVIKGLQRKKYLFVPLQRMFAKPLPLYLHCPIFSLNIFVEETRSSFLQSFSIFCILLIASLPIVIYHVPLYPVLLIYPHTDQTKGVEQIQAQYLARFDYQIQVLSVRPISFQVYNHVLT